MLDDFKKTIENQKVLQSLDERLLKALFAPAVNAGVFEFDGMPWEAPANRERADALIDQLLPLSEFYQQNNPPLSAAIWGIWNAVRYLRRQRSLLSILTESKKKDEETFVAVRALVATAAIQFADGTASTMVTSDAMNNLATYRKCAEEAIRNIGVNIG